MPGTTIVAGRASKTGPSEVELLIGELYALISDISQNEGIKKNPHRTRKVSSNTFPRIKGIPSLQLFCQDLLTASQDECKGPENNFAIS
jgi:hypothetical protein